MKIDFFDTASIFQHSRVNREEAWYYSIYYLFIPLISGDKLKLKHLCLLCVVKNLKYTFD